MLGNPLRVDIEGLAIKLRPHEKSEMETFGKLFSSLQVQMYTNRTFALTTEHELEWLDKCRNDTSSVSWGIATDKENKLIGTTGLHDISQFTGSCTSGIVIANQEYWGKGIAYRAHLARTWYAVNVLNRLTIQSHVRADNPASLKALQKVGYTLTGKLVRNWYRLGKYMDTYVLTWINPEKTNLLFPEGIPEEFKIGIEKAKIALDIASKTVQLP